jgi:hypothetical protein
MDGSITIGDAERRGAHRRVGAGAGAMFLVLFVLIAAHGRADAQPSVPGALPAATPTVQPQEGAPADPSQDPGFGRRRGRFGPRGNDGRQGFGGGGVPDGSGGGGTVPAPSTEATTTS